MLEILHKLRSEPKSWWNASEQFMKQINLDLNWDYCDLLIVFDFEKQVLLESSVVKFEVIVRGLCLVKNGMDSWSL